MNDLISRQAAIKEFGCCELTPDGGIDANYAIDFLKQLPSAQHEPIRLRLDHELSKEEYERLKKGCAEQPIILLPKESAQQWIPCSERLPEDEQEIIFSTKTGRVHSGRYHDDNSANQWYSHLDRCRAWNNVVDAWMPLPEPYKGE